MKEATARVKNLDCKAIMIQKKKDLEHNQEGVSNILDSKWKKGAKLEGVHHSTLT